MLLTLAAIGCSGPGGNPVSPGPETGTTSQTADVRQAGNICVLGCYDVYFDYASRTLEIVDDRTSAYTVNVMPFLKQMISPPNGITIGSLVIHDDDPTFLGVDVELQVYHPFPGMDQYKAYDLMAIIIGDGADTLSYDNLSVGRHGSDLWMKNADGFSRWFNPTEFTTELIFGYCPGGFQNYAGNALLNPYKYYAKGLGDYGDLWEFLTSGDNNEGVFESGDGRLMELEFPLPPDGIGLMFGLVVACCWEEQGPNPPGGYTPYHRDEAVAISVTQTPDVWYDENLGSGGKLILDIDSFAWEEQPSTIKIESSVLPSIAEFDFETYASYGGDHYSTWHVEADAGELTSDEGHYFWVIAESEGYDYKNGLPEIPSADGPLAAFFRFDCEVIGQEQTPITVINPNGGETLWEALYYEITWDPGTLPITDVKIEWSTDNFNSDIRTIAASTPNDGSYTWVPIPNVETTTARVRISDTMGSSTDTSDDDFAIALPVWLEFQPEVEVSTSTVNFATWPPRYYEKWLDEFSPALSHDFDGMVHIIWHGEGDTAIQRFAHDVTIRSMDGNSWSGEGDFLHTEGYLPQPNPFRGDYLKLAASSTHIDTTFAAVIYKPIYFCRDVDRWINFATYFNNCNNPGPMIYLNCELMADDDYLYLVSDGWRDGTSWDGPGIYCMRTPTPAPPDPFQCTERHDYTDNGEISHSRSWAFHSNTMVMAFYRLDGQIRLLRQTDIVSDIWDDTEVIFDGSGYSDCKDPALAADGNDRLFAVWTGQEMSSGVYHLLASMKESADGEWTDPVIAAVSSQPINDGHVSCSAEQIMLPTGDSEYLVLIGYESDGVVFSGISPMNLWAFLPARQVSAAGDDTRDPDTLCLEAPYVYDSLFAWSFMVDEDNWDIKFRNADFQTP